MPDRPAPPSVAGMPPASTPLDPNDVCLYLDRLFAVAWSLSGSRHDAEDLVQETVATVLQRPRRLHGADPLAYLMTALRNTHRNRYRTRQRRPIETELPVELHVNGELKAVKKVKMAPNSSGAVLFELTRPEPRIVEVKIALEDDLGR